MPKAPSAKLAEPKTDNIEETRVKGTKTLEVLSPSAEVTVPKAQKGLAAGSSIFYVGGADSFASVTEEIGRAHV